MGFLAAEVPRLLLNLLFLLDHLRRLSSWLLRLVGIGIHDNLSLTFDYPTASDFADHHYHHHHHHHGLELELEKHSPVVRFNTLSSVEDGTLLLPESCAVCLGDFHSAACVRRPQGCQHVFHRACLDRWAAHGHSTCPLCRALLLPPFLMPLPLPAS
ncbi:RING-H2 finger protein ATL39-like [Triticum dicoccoides]|uniref:RING-H2 finger protein ATL39-like n=1 Tax=Triticum dicoccoides TaxID=85692 RepID=UPI00188E00F2|nr:RING-H2 finger protein ATL39-like [Triticum dicoccoides]